MPARPRPRRRAHPREFLLRRGQTAFRYTVRGPRRPDYQRRCATGYRQNSHTPSRPFVWIASSWIALLLTSSFRRRAFNRRFGRPAPSLGPDGGSPAWSDRRDRKSTRLKSSHLVISYAVFCLKKKKIYKVHVTL